ncbi:hypothetical protein [Dyadobacter bucti]|uniref:hypothetical protein n=1 Tax=Dyadobacter bucti TaxID=2572203 RepID=UPI003F6E56A7
MELPISINGVIFVALLIVPGVILKKFYFQGKFTTQFGAGIFADRLISSIFLGFMIQLVSLFTIGKYFEISLESFVKPFTIYTGDIAKQSLPNDAYDHIKYLFLYLISNIVVGAGIGTIAHKIVRLLRLDVIFHIFRFDNQWNYYFRGDILYSWDFKPRKKGKVLSTVVDLILDVDHDGKKKMVSGILTEYSISSKTGELDLIYLTEAKRFSHKYIDGKDEETGLETKRKVGMTDIDGDCMIIPYNKVIDINLHYIIKEIDRTKRKEILTTVFGILTLAGVTFLMVFPWWLDVSFLRLIAGIITSMFGWILGVTLLIDLFVSDDDKKMTWGARLSLLTLIVVIAVGVLKIYKISVNLPYWPF